MSVGKSVSLSDTTKPLRVTGVKLHSTLILQLSHRYTVNGKPPKIIVTENGCDVPGESSMPLAEALQDSFR